MARIFAIFLTGFVCLTLHAFARQSLPPVEYPAADTEHICPTSDPKDCYPSIFQPTEDFQPIKEGQNIPLGLHVRLNIYTGEKEARLNIPLDKQGETIEGQRAYPGKAVALMPQSEEPEEKHSAKQSVHVVPKPEIKRKKSALQDQVPITPPIYEMAGKIKSPPLSDDEFRTFQRALLTIKIEAQDFDQALDDLSELAHDIYYGLEIVKDVSVLEKLVCLTLGLGSEKMPAKEGGRERKAAAILSSALQNNPSASKEIGTWKSAVMFPACGEHLSDRKREEGDFVSTFRRRLRQEEDAATLRSKVGVINGILKEGVIQDAFLEHGGMELLLAIFLKKGEDFDIVRKKIAQVLTDNFFDENLGAQLGIWPKTQPSEEKICQTRGTILSDGCWEYHVKVFSEEAPKEDWARHFLEALKRSRPKGEARDEL